MSLLKLIAAGALGVVAYKAWQQHQANQARTSPVDDGSRTTPHGDPVLAGEQIDVAPSPRAASHSSRGFGET